MAGRRAKGPGATSPATLYRLALVVLLLGAAVVAWTSPEGAGDLRPSPDAVEYGLGAADLASLDAPRLRIGDVAAPSRYPFGFSLLAAPFVRLAAGSGRPEPGAAVLAVLAAAVVVVGAVAVTGRRAFGAPAGVVAAALVVASPFYAVYSRQVMAEMPTAALFTAAGLLLAGIAGRRTPAVGAHRGRAWVPWGPVIPAFLLGTLLALAVVVRLSNLQAVPAAAAALGVAAPGRRRPALGGLLLGLATGCAPLLLANWVTFGGPLITGYHLWTPEWAGEGRAAFGLQYALHRPALPGSAVQGNLAHYAGAWLGLPAFGDGGQPVGSPVSATLAGALAAGAVLGLWRATSAGPAARTLAVYVAAGVAGAVLFYTPYYYQDARYLAPWVPLWLTLAAAGLLWPTRLPSPIRPPVGAPGAARLLPVMGVAGVVLVLATLAGLPATVAASPAWRAAIGGHRQGASPRLAQLRALAGEAPPDAWIVSAIDGPLMDYHVLRGTRRRYVPLARGLEFVDKPPFKSVPAASDLSEAIASRLAGGAGTVVIDRWSVEFAEGLPDFHRELDRLTASADLIPGGSGAPSRPTYYVLRPPSADHGLAHYALRDGDAVRDSAGRVSVYRAGERRHVPSIAALQAAGLRWDDVRRLPDAVLAAIPEGRPLEG